MGGSVQLDKWFREGRSVAALLPAEGLFGVLRRTIELPAAFAALTRRSDGHTIATAPGGKVAGDDGVDILFVRSTPLELAWVCPQLASKDRYLCDARVTLALRVLTERAELEALRDQVMGSRAALNIDDLQRYLQPHVERALLALVAEHDAEALVEGQSSAAAAQAVADALQAPCFSSGLVLAADPLVAIASTAYQRTREAEQRAARARDEHAAQSELRDALARAQRAHLDHLEGMLTRLNQLAERSPTVELPELMRSFEESQRGQLYQALIASRARRRVTRWLAVVAGHEVLFFDAADPSTILRRVRIESRAGALRSIQHDSDTGLLLLGAARGVYLLDPEAAEPAATLLVANDRPLRGGFNAVAVRGDDVLATHSELGVIRWRRSRSAAGEPVLVDQTAGASAVRCAQFAGDNFWCTVDESAVSIRADFAGEPRVFPFSRGVLSALCAANAALFAGTSEGDILEWADLTQETAPQRIHGGSRRPAESLALITVGGIPRLFYSDTSLAVHCRIVGDTFVCRYEAGGQTVRRAECAADVIAATTDARDRVLLWKIDDPQRPAAMVSVLRLAGHSVQDVCLVPMPEAAA